MTADFLKTNLTLAYKTLSGYPSSHPDRALAGRRPNYTPQASSFIVESDL
jgi:hypothetical protein